MPDPHLTYSVILKAELPSVERELLRRYCHELHSDDGATLLQFLCTSIDLSHPAYVEMQVLAPKSQSASLLRIPHAYVFLIDGGIKKSGIGFLNHSPLPSP